MLHNVLNWDSMLKCPGSASFPETMKCNSGFDFETFTNQLEMFPGHGIGQWDKGALSRDNKGEFLCAGKA